MHVHMYDVYMYVYMYVLGDRNFRRKGRLAGEKTK